MSGLKDLQRVWNRLGAEDPYWAVLSDPAKRGNRWDVAAFFESGRSEIAAVMSYLARLRPDAEHQRALDFGCGAGRLTQALADYYGEVAAIAIAPPMVALPQRHNRHGERCRVNASGDLAPFETGTFDLVYFEHHAPAHGAALQQGLYRGVRPRPPAGRHGDLPAPEPPHGAGACGRERG